MRATKYIKVEEELKIDGQENGRNLRHELVIDFMADTEKRGLRTNGVHQQQRNETFHLENVHHHGVRGKVEVRGNSDRLVFRRLTLLNI